MMDIKFQLGGIVTESLKLFLGNVDVMSLTLTFSVIVTFILIVIKIRGVD